MSAAKQTHWTGPVAGLSGVALWCSRPPWTAPLAHPPRRGRGQPVPLGGRARGGLPTAPRPCAVPVDNRKRLTHRPLALLLFKTSQEAGDTRPGEAWACPCLPVRGMFLARGAGLPPRARWAGEEGALRTQTPSSW